MQFEGTFGNEDSVGQEDWAAINGHRCVVQFSAFLRFLSRYGTDLEGDVAQSHVHRLHDIQTRHRYINAFSQSAPPQTVAKSNHAPTTWGVLHARMRLLTLGLDKGTLIMHGGVSRLRCGATGRFHLLTAHLTAAALMSRVC